jgi:hypothetical protein
MKGNRQAPTFPRTYPAPMKAVKDANMKLKTKEIVECGFRSQTGNQRQNITKYEKKIATNHLLGRDFCGILW